MEKQTLSVNGVAKTVIESIKKAHDRYKQMSGGWWLQHAPEYFMTATVSSDLFKKFNVHIYMDASMSRIWNTELGDSRVNNLKAKKNRSDITVWNRDSGTVFCCIELKKNAIDADIVKDINRLRGLIGRTYGCEYGIMAVFLSNATQVKTYKDRIEGLKKSGNLKIEPLTFYSKEVDEEGHRWSVFVMILS